MSTAPRARTRAGAACAGSDERTWAAIPSADVGPPGAGPGPGDRLVLRCLCGAVATLDRGDLTRLVGADAPLDPIGLRVRCARCGQPPRDGWFEWERGGDDARRDGRRDHHGGV